jgi:MFS-type transporter involved in bile tolerance (Atg22 family)
MNFIFFIFFQFIYTKFILIHSKKTQKEWQQVFLITAVIYLVGGIATVLFATDNKTKSWALETTEKKAEEMPLKEQ